MVSCAQRLRFGLVSLVTSTVLVVAGITFPHTCLETVAEWRYGIPRAIAIHEEHLFLGSGTGLIVYSAPAVGLLLEIARLELPAAPLDIKVSGNIAVLALGADGIAVVDVSDPQNPALVGAIPLPGSAVEVVLGGSLAYVAADGLRIVDVTDPSSPVLVGGYAPSQEAGGIDLVGSTVLIALRAGVSIVDVTDASSPTELAYLPTEGTPGDVVVLNNHAWVTDQAGSAYGQTGLVSYDIRNPSVPLEIGHLDGLQVPTEISVVGGFLYVSTRWGMWIVNVSDPATPVDEGRIWYRRQPSMRVVAAGERGFVLEEDWWQYSHWSGPPDVIRILDVSSPEAPVEIGELQTAGWTKAIAAANGLAYIASHTSGLHIFDLNGADGPAMVGSLTDLDTAHNNERALGIAVRGPQVFVGACSSGLVVVDVSDPTTPVVVGSAQSPDVGGIEGCEEDVFLDGQNAFTKMDGPSWALGMSIFDIGVPALPEWQSGIRFANQKVGAVAAEGNLAFVGYSQVIPGLTVVDISDPTAPDPLGWVSLPAIPGGIALLAQKVLVADYAAGLLVIDVSTPSQPQEIASLDPPFHAYSDVVVRDDIAYVADFQTHTSDRNFVRAIDVSDVLNPQEIAAVPIPVAVPATYAQLAVDGDFVFVTLGDSGFRVLQACGQSVFSDGFESGNFARWSATVHRCQVPRS